MKTDLYNKVTDLTGAQPTKQLFSSIRLYLQDYKDTSNSKEERLKALKDADTLTDWVISDVLIYGKEDVGSKMFSIGIYNISNTIKAALVNPQTLFDVKDAIGFLSIIEK